MTPAEFRVIRESLGMTVAATAQALGVLERSVSFWDRGRRPIPEGVISELQRWLRDAEALIERYVEELAGAPSPTLTTFRDGDYEATYPASWHRAVAARVAERIPGLRITY